MKIFDQLRNLKFLSLIATIITVTTFSSCSKDNDDDMDNSGTARVRVINTVQGSVKQNFFVDDQKVTTSAVGFAETSDYLRVVAGDHDAEFRGTSSTTVSFDMDVKAGKYYTVYLTGSAESSSYVVVEDDMTPPPSGKAKVRFVHVSSAAASGVDIAMAGLSKFINDLKYKAASAYTTVDANTKFMLYAAGSSDVALNLDTQVQAGKIYTVFITGATAATITYRVVAQN